MRLKPIFCLFLAFAIIFSGCAEKKQSGIGISVVDLRSGEPLSGAEVSVYLGETLVKSALTGADGKAFIEIFGPAGEVYYRVGASAKDYVPQTKNNIKATGEGTNALFQLEYAKALPIPAGRFYEDAVISDSLGGAGAYSGRVFTLIIYKTVLNDSGGVDRAIFRLTEGGNTVSAKAAYAGDDLRNVFLDANGAKILGTGVSVKSLGYDRARQLGYADAVVGKT